MELRALAITPLVTSVEFPIMPIRITVAVAQSGRHLSAVPAPLLAVSGPTGWCAAAMPAFPSPGTAELSRRACAVEVIRAGNVCIRCSGRAVTWLARPTGTRSAHMPSTPRVAARESRRVHRHRCYDRGGNCCGSEDGTHSRRPPTVSLCAQCSLRASTNGKHRLLQFERSVVDQSVPRVGQFPHGLRMI